MELTEQKKYKILLAIVTLFANDSETRDISNVISDAILKMRIDGDPTMTEDKALPFWEFLKVETKKVYPNWTPEPWREFK